MTTYYQILGIGPRANSTEIRAAYKKMAMAYHPDHNPGYPEAEEIFKMVNEAYHTLSDPLKKSRYDAMLFPQYHIELEPSRVTRQRYRHVNIKGGRYKIDKQYFRHQALSVLVYIALAGFCFALMNAIQYYVELRQSRDHYANVEGIKQAGALFGAGKFDDAISLMKSITARSPFEFRVYSVHDSLVNTLRSRANASFDAKDYAAATPLYEVLHKHESRVVSETVRRISMGHYYLGHYRESLDAMNVLFDLHPENPELSYSMAILNLDKLNNPEEALRLLDVARAAIERRTIQTSLKAIAIRGSDPKLFTDIYAAKAEANIALKRFDYALLDINTALKHDASDGRYYKLRATANAGLDKMETVCKDIYKARRLGFDQVEELERAYCR